MLTRQPPPALTTPTTTNSSRPTVDTTVNTHNNNTTNSNSSSAMMTAVAERQQQQQQQQQPHSHYARPSSVPACGDVSYFTSLCGGAGSGGTDPTTPLTIDTSLLLMQPDNSLAQQLAATGAELAHLRNTAYLTTPPASHGQETAATPTLVKHQGICCCCFLGLRLGRPMMCAYFSHSVSLSRSE